MWRTKVLFLFALLYFVQGSDSEYELPDFLDYKYTSYDKEHGQYADVATIAEIIILRQRAYRYNLENAHTIKYNLQNISTNLRALGVAETDVLAFETDSNDTMAIAETSLLNIMTKCDTTKEHLESTNNHIAVDATADIETDIIILNNDQSTLNTSYSFATYSIKTEYDSLRKDVIIYTIGLTPGPSLDMINELLANTEALILNQDSLMAESKKVLDSAFAELFNALNILVTVP